MFEELSLPELVRRARDGEDDAAKELIRSYEPYVRRAVRLSMRNPKLRRSFDSADICQSVLRSFFARLVLGHYELERPEQLIQLLTVMARNKVATQSRKLQISRRDERALENCGQDGLEPVATDPDPTWRLEGRDLLEAIRRRLTPEEGLISELRQRGCSWAEVAGETGGTPDAARKKFARAIDRVTRQLGLDDAEDG